MALDPYDQYLDDSRVQLRRTSATARTRRAAYLKKYGKKKGLAKYKRSGERKRLYTTIQNLRARQDRADDPLSIKPRKELLLQARGLTNRAFEGVDKGFDEREARARSIAEKQRVDNIYFAQWQNSKLAEQQEKAAQADEQLIARQRELDAAQQARHGAQQEVASRPGSVSTVADIQGSSAFARLKDVEAQTGDLGRAQNVRTLAQLGSGAKTREYTRAATSLAQQATEAKRQSNLWRGLAEISDDRTKAALQKAAAGADIISNLLNQQVQVSQSNREFALAGQKLGAEVQDEAEKRKAANKKYNLDVKKFNETKRTNRVNQRFKEMKEIREAREFTAKEKREWAELNRKIAKDQKGGKPSAGARKLFKEIDTLVPLAGSHKKGYKDWMNYMLKTDASYDAAVIRGAAEVSKNGKLSYGTYRRLKDAGAYIPRRWHPKYGKGKSKRHPTRT